MPNGSASRSCTSCAGASAAARTSRTAACSIRIRFPTTHAAGFARRVRSAAGSGNWPAQIDLAFRIALSRPPSQQEGEWSQRLLAEHAAINGVSKKSYEDTLKGVAALRPTVDAFFEAVMVMDKDPKIKDNRLRLLGQLKRLVADIADFENFS